MFDKTIVRGLLAFSLVVSAVSVRADVFNMPAGQKSIVMVPVGNPGNFADSAFDSGLGTSTSPGTGAGVVGYVFDMDAYDVTLAQYTAFLNSVAKTDTYGLYNTTMYAGYTFGISRFGSQGNYFYSVTNPLAANMPIYSETWGDAARFCNWLQNGQPTSGTQGAGTTETGAYTMSGATTETDLMAVTRTSSATYVIPTEDEWYKAAYYDPLLNNGSGGYWTYATQSNTAPDNSLALATSESNDANYNQADPTNGLTPVGTFTLSPSYYGTFDQSGDIWQWNEDAVVAGLSRGYRGGDWIFGAANMASYNPQSADPASRIINIGFRVASVPEPGSVALLLAGAVGLLAYSRLRQKRRALGIAAESP